MEKKPSYYTYFSIEFGKRSLRNNFIFSAFESGLQEKIINCMKSIYFLRTFQSGFYSFIIIIRYAYSALKIIVRITLLSLFFWSKRGTKLLGWVQQQAGGREGVNLFRIIHPTT